MHMLASFDLSTNVQLVLAGRLLIAALLGAILGIERSVAGKHAGMRTYALVSLGSCLFVITAILATYQFAVFSNVNPLMIASNVVVAIGFLGAGLSVFRGEHPVELTTAAGLWISAAVGMGVGFGYFTLSAITVVLSLLTFSFLLKIENRIRTRFGKGN